MRGGNLRCAISACVSALMLGAARGSIVLTAVGLVAFGTAHGQSQEQGEAESGGVLEEVIVTATRREESLQDVAIAVTVVSGLTLEQLNIVDSKELVRLVPSLTLSGNPYGNFAQSWQIRGVGTIDTPTLPQSVAVVTDGMPLANSAMLRMDYSDIERIEVLGGPQGTLFGPNSTAGVISITTRNPVLDQTDFPTRVSYGKASEFDDLLLQATANIGLGESAALRINAYYHDRSGYITNLFNGQKQNAYKDVGIRAKLLWQASENFRMLFTGELSAQDDPYRQNVVTEVIPGSPLDLEYQRLGIVPGLGNTKISSYYRTEGESDVVGAMLQMDWTLGEYLLTSLSGYRKYEMDGMFADLINTPEPSIFGTNDGPFTHFTQELKLTSPASDSSRFEYVTGLFFDRFKVDSKSIYGLQEPAFICSGPVSPGEGCAFEWHYIYETQSVAAYANATFHLSDQWRLIAGGRVTKDWLDFTFDRYLAPGYTVMFSTPLTGVVSDGGDSDFTWQFGPQFYVNDDVMLYATVSTGYKAGGFSSTGIQTADQDIRVDPETSLNYAIGMKSTWLDGRLLANIDLFHTTFDDFQTYVALELPTGRTVFVTQNAKEMETKGVGASFTYAPVSELRLFANIAYTNATFTDYKNAACYPGQVENCDRSSGVAISDASGYPLPNSPKWIYSLGGRYRFPLSQGMEGFVTADWYYRTKTNLSQVLDPSREVPAYGILGAAIGVEDPGGKWSFALSAKNLLDETFCSLPNQYTFGAIFGGVTTCTYSEQAFRTFYATLDFRF